MYQLEGFWKGSQRAATHGLVGLLGVNIFLRALGTPSASQEVGMMKSEGIATLAPVCLTRPSYRIEAAFACQAKGGASSPSRCATCRGRTFQSGPVSRVCVHMYQQGWHFLSRDWQYSGVRCNAVHWAHSIGFIRRSYRF